MNKTKYNSNTKKLALAATKHHHQQQKTTTTTALAWIHMVHLMRRSDVHKHRKKESRKREKTHII